MVKLGFDDAKSSVLLHQTASWAGLPGFLIIIFISFYSCETRITVDLTWLMMLEVVLSVHE